MAKKYPVMDDNTRTAMVLGFASTEAGARRVAAAWAKSNEVEGVIGVDFVASVEIDFDEDLNTPRQHRLANAAGRGWVVRINDITVA